VSDEDLARAYLQALAEGNLQLAAQLRDQLWQQLYERGCRLARSWVRCHRFTLDDLMQEAWLQFDTVLHRWNPDHIRSDGSASALWPWLRVVLDHRFRDLHRGPCTVGGTLVNAIDSGERERRRSHFRIVFQSLRTQSDDPERIRWIDCTERHWLEDVPVADLAGQHGVRLGRVYAWLREIEPAFGRELLRLYPEYGQG
jgi:hypothetical protein